MPNYRRARTPGATYFFTAVTYKRRGILTTPESRQILRDVVNDVKRRLPFTVDAWALLPEHIHCIWTLPVEGRYLLKAEKEFYRRYRDILELEDEETKNVEMTMRKLNTGEEGAGYSAFLYDRQKNFLQGSAKRTRGILGISDSSAIGTVTSSSFKPRLANGYPGFIKGFVFDKDTNEKIKKATVAAQGTKGSYKTTENGAYFLQLNSGAYTVSSDASGYETSIRKVRVDALSTTTENIGLAQATQPAGVSGQVKDRKNNKSLEGVTITVRKKAFRESVVTDSSGNYSFTGLESGKYRLVAAKSGYKNYKKDINFRTGETKKLNVRMEKK